jgi:hypothetical protein
MADKNRKSRLELLAEFAAAPSSALFPQPYIAALRDCSEANIARDRGLGQGVPFLRIGNRILYRKADYLAWEEQHKPVRSTAEARAQRRLREAANIADRIAAGGR